MKIPLRFQMIEEDNGKETLLNAINYLFDREDIDNDLISNIDSYFDDNDVIKKESLCEFAKKVLKLKKYNFELKYFSNEEVTIKNIKDNFKDNVSCAIVSVYLNEKIHYVLLTSLDNTYAYLFDSYYLDDIYFDIDRQVEIIFDDPFKINRKVNLKRFTGMSLSDFSMGPQDIRECLIIKKTR